MHRKIRCVSSPRSTYNRRLPSISLAGVWLKKAGFEVGDFARITVADGVLVISSERVPDNENREKGRLSIGAAFVVKHGYRRGRGYGVIIAQK